MQKIPIRRDSLDQLQEELKQLKTVNVHKSSKLYQKQENMGTYPKMQNTMRLEKDRVL